MDSYDLVIIGSGTAAQMVGSRMRAAGWSVALVDHRPFGGTCALRGCDPKKMLISGAEAIDAQARMRGHGVVGDARIDWRDWSRSSAASPIQCPAVGSAILPKAASPPCTGSPASLPRTR
jgi:pyruvate/2-oxoglutarate dehydrogenase complex dihydrolipoamide dehydrogenase (E3) component